MAIPETEPVKNHYGNNSATSFDFDFYIEKSSQLKVQHTDLNGLLTTLKENVDYSIHEIGNENGSYITFPISGSTYDILKWDTVNDKKELLTISLNIPLKQEFEFDISGDLDKHQVEKAFDYQMRVDQILNRKINRAVLVPEGSELTPSELIETLQNSKAEAVQAASDAAMSATNAQNSANLSKEQSDIASDKLNTINQKMEEFSDNYNFATNDIQNKHSDAILDIQNNLQTAEDTIIADRTEAIQAITKNKNNSISDITTAGAEQVANIQQIGFYMQDGKLYYINSDGETKEFQSGSSLLPGFLYPVTGRIDESKNIFRYANGQVIDENESVKGLTAFLDEQEKLGSDIFCTETEWQAIKNTSKLGQCGKYVRDKEAGTIRLPLVININGLTDLSKAGLIKDESLPNIQFGVDGSIVANYGSSSGTAVTFTGALTGTSTRAGTISGGANYFQAVTNLSLDASNSNSTYQDNAPVQQEAIQYPYVICVNTGVEEAERPINNYMVNNVYSYGISQYYGGEMNNLSWLKSNSQSNSGTVYTGFYNWAVANIGKPFGMGYIKESSATDITDYDLVINQGEQSFILPLIAERILIESKKPTDDDTTWYNLYSDGWCEQGGNLGMGPLGVGDGKVITLLKPYKDTSYAITLGSSNNDTSANAVTVPHGNMFYGSYKNDSKTKSSFRVVVNGSWKTSGYVDTSTIQNNINLYYYVGDTAENVDLINAGRIGEQIVDLNATYANTYKKTTDNKAICKLLAPDWSAGVTLTLNTNITISQVGWVLMRNTLYWGTFGGTINGIQVYYHSGTERAFEDWNSMMFMVNTGDVVRLDGGELKFFPCKGAV